MSILLVMGVSMYIALIVYVCQFMHVGAMDALIRNRLVLFQSVRCLGFPQINIHQCPGYAPLYTNCVCVYVCMLSM